MDEKDRGAGRHRPLRLGGRSRGEPASSSGSHGELARQRGSVVLPLDDVDDPRARALEPEPRPGRRPQLLEPLARGSRPRPCVSNSSSTITSFGSSVPRRTRCRRDTARLATDGIAVERLLPLVEVAHGMVRQSARSRQSSRMIPSRRPPERRRGQSRCCTSAWLLVEEVADDGLLRGAHLVEPPHRPRARRVLQHLGRRPPPPARSARIASTKSSSRSFGSVSVGSIISASGTTSGK